MREVRGSAAESYARANLWFGLAGAILIALVVFGLVPRDKEESPAPTTSTSVRQGVQEPLWLKIPAECRVVGPIAPECLEGLTTGERDALTCQYEDGNADGTPCVWVRPGDGLLWVDSAQYRN